MAKEVKKPIRPFAIDCGGPSKTIQSHAVGTSAREIMEQYRVTGQVPQSLAVPQFFDTTKFPSLVEALNVGAQFNTFFANLPAEVRDEFRNDPKRLMSAFSDPKLKGRLIELGIVKAPPKEKPVLGSKENPIHSVIPAVAVDDAEPPAKGKGSAK